MKLFAPKYYKEFSCIADRCRHSCCVGWEIDIDSDTMEKYKTVCGDFGEEIRNSIEGEDCPHFRLCADERCPHLDGQGLCRIIKGLGEGFLCDICREHPRFYNDVPEGTEVGLGLCCEEAARIILSSDGYSEISDTESLEGETVLSKALSVRGELYRILSDRGVDYTERLSAIYERCGVSPSLRTDGEWRAVLESLEYLCDSHRELFCSYSSALQTPKELAKPLERALAYFLYRHLSAAEDDGEIRSAVGFSLLCERLICSVAAATGERVEDVARIASEELEYCEDNTEALRLEFLF